MTRCAAGESPLYPAPAPHFIPQKGTNKLLLRRHTAVYPPSSSKKSDTPANTVHLKINRTKCEICGADVSKNNINSHMRRHIDVKPFKCSFKPCGKRFKDKVSQ
ncbi:hypothetical protein B5X24_HaOG215310 [Helicoverpa armigera]|uniref:C2H2-type domain-containing protein n=1 Tax=Helicoverpa armigera TaxID=29058 RepID=A0A2W1B954_HELAM|nr:hypothetical protein B5X24_HaOG215310 [Helicoverpa armigera]